MKKFVSTIAVVVMLLASTLLLAGCFGGGDGNYKINIESCQHGIITVDKSSAKEGEKVEVTAIAENGYQLSVITCDGVVLQSTTITMPKHDIKLAALFKATGSTGTGSGEAEIDLNLGTYVCQIEYDVETDYEWDYSKPTYHFNTITFKEGNKADVCVYLSGEGITSGFYKLDNVLYTREGNTLSANAFDYSVTIKIVDENNVVAILKGREDDTILALTRKENEVITDGTFEGNVWEDYNTNAYQKLSLTFAGSNVDVKFFYCNGTDAEELMVSGSANYELRGNRLFVTLGEKTYCARINVETGYIQLRHLSEVNEDGISYVLDDDSWVYLWSEAA